MSLRKEFILLSGAPIFVVAARGHFTMAWLWWLSFRFGGALARLYICTPIKTFRCYRIIVFNVLGHFIQEFLNCLPTT